MRGYKVVMSSNVEVKIDADELAVVQAGVARGGIIQLKQGLVNPSFIVAVVPDKDRVARAYGDGSVAEMPALVNVFEKEKLQVAEKMTQQLEN